VRVVFLDVVNARTDVNGRQIIQPLSAPGYLPLLGNSGEISLLSMPFS
jgi:hypothetical protein